MRRVLLWAAAIALCILALWLAAKIPRTITVFVIAGFIAFGVQPVVVHLEERRMKRPLAILLVYAILLILTIVGIVLVVPATLEQSQVLMINAPGYLKASQAWIVQFETTLRTHFGDSSVPATFGNLQNLVSAKIGALLTGSLASLGTLLIDTATAIFIGLSALILSFFFLLQDRQIGDAFASIFPANKQGTARELVSEITRIFGSFISGQAIVSAITGLVITIALELVGFKYALILGIISGIAYAVPIVGMLAAHVLGAIIAAPQGLGMIVSVQVVLFIMARISDNVLVPKIMGSSVGVSPIGVMFAVFAGGELFGLPGLLLGIPAAALIKVLWKFFISPAIRGKEAGSEDSLS
ncbi:MAG: AI-2E family transporter, partial [Candidatus Eremiobacteraeota bacterium]|nr:AI-2E family transporter [Candidatus Eremiobacteraeota bacterium]